MYSFGVAKTCSRFFVTAPETTRSRYERPDRRGSRCTRMYIRWQSPARDKLLKRFIILSMLLEGGNRGQGGGGAGGWTVRYAALRGSATWLEILPTGEGTSCETPAADTFIKISFGLPTLSAALARASPSGRRSPYPVDRACYTKLRKLSRDIPRLSARK